MSLSLRLFPPILVGQGRSLDLTTKITGWRRSIRLLGGFWLGDFSLHGNINDLATIWYDYLGAHFEERFNGRVTWEGLVYEADLTYYAHLPGGPSVSITRRRSLDLLYNYVSGTYVDEADAVQVLSPVSNTASIARYERREEHLLMDGYPQAAAEARRDTYLKENQHPTPRVVGIRNVAAAGYDATLDVTVAGYWLTANWRYRSAGDGSTVNLSAFIEAILGADCPLLKVGRITPNTLQVVSSTNLPTRAGDTILDQVELGDASGNPHRIYVDVGRYAHYEPIEKTPRYFLRGGQLYGTAGSRSIMNPWEVVPAVARDLTFPVPIREYSGWLEDGRDVLLTEVEAGTGSGLVLKSDIFEESELLAAQEEYRSRLESEQEEDEGGAGKKRNQPWKGITTPREWERMSPAQRRAAKAAKKRRKQGN